MSGSDSGLLVLARSTAVVGLGLVSGLTLSVPAWFWPALYRPDSTLSPSQRLSLWSTLYSQGKRTMTAVIPTAVALLSYAAWAAKPAPSYLPAGWVARHRQGVLAAAAAATAGIAVFTVVAMEGLNGSLKQLERDAKTNGAPVLPSHGAQIRTRWARLHLVRCALAGSAFVAGVAELALA
ncbi:hypothetical protein DMC30DRAFT_444289 [Rhodotorula diobovata]|uniref:DUF1772-domain-containing protein n=1 Tax=Rhodotorula diobovata TaxID=5288 RepID=A0A5C5G394_9BASI|nr:hypothetical protein DMC30DRAFT_444289 [Rhodotorula diobovata]